MIDDCTRVMCGNCSEEHPSSSNQCKKFQQAKEILAIKIKNKCSMLEARNIYRTQLTIPPVNSNASYGTVLSSNDSSHVSTTQSTSIPKHTINKENNNIKPLNNIQSNSVFTTAQDPRAHLTQSASTSNAIVNQCNNNTSPIKTNAHLSFTHPSDRTLPFSSNSLAYQQHHEENFSRIDKETSPYHTSNNSLNNFEITTDVSFTNNAFSPLPSLNISSI
ncbi:unnamed protein product [Ceratitis capitata]|uniref:(Mediterranean fruit fly) hypothetical protein n=1 Tax=Ceratitis capitata TaxID=7213 RepID=A0A811UK13_CERCA|nr:unnamed protein product [Ceratitis capitata]